MTPLETGKPFIDTNILLYALVPGDPRSAASEAILALCPLLSVQVLNEAVDVLKRKSRWSWTEIQESLAQAEELCGPPLPLTHAVHRIAVEIAQRREYRIYDALILASALQAGCTTLYTEDMQDGQRIDSLVIRNPFLQN